MSKVFQDFLNITQTTVIQDINDVFNDIVIIEKDDMVITSRQKFVFRYSLGSQTKNKEHVWVTKELGKNSNNEVILVKTTDISYKQPSWIPFSDEELTLYES